MAGDSKDIVSAIVPVVVCEVIKAYGTANAARIKANATIEAARIIADAIETVNIIGSVFRQGSAANIIETNATIESGEIEANATIQSTEIKASETIQSSLE